MPFPNFPHVNYCADKMYIIQHQVISEGISDEMSSDVISK